jgi:regulator of Ty1 transposition protein 109
MAASENSPGANISLKELLAEVLPKDAAFRLYHVSTPPASTEAIYFPPPGEIPDRTFCESHFLAVSINPSSTSLPNTDKTAEVLVFAIEILIYSTAHTTTLFVSKADSSGYLHLLNLPTGSPSPLREISSTFLSYLVERRRRPGIRTIVSLFARAQDQYLFARSIHNKGKHVLDDRGLVKWWCKVLDPLINTANEKKINGSWEDVRGYLLVPGLDNYETRSFLPPSSSASSSSSSAVKPWSVGHPLTQISRFPSAPPRCLIPHFPDDPKSRFLDELDDELNISSGKANGQWKSVRSLEQFWELMAFRQECSAGRMVGFIWVVFTPQESVPQYITPASQASQTSRSQSQQSQGPDTQVTISTYEDGDTPLDRPSFTPDSSFISSIPPSPAKSRRSTAPAPRRNPHLSGPIIPRSPRIKTHARNLSASRPAQTRYYVWPLDSRGQVVLEDKDYRRFNELLLCLDFANVTLAREATSRWTGEVSAGKLEGGEGRGSWGEEVVGKRIAERARNGDGAKGGKGFGVNMMNVLNVRKKRKSAEGESKPAKEVDAETNDGADKPKINVLGVGMVRKKAKS